MFRPSALRAVVLCAAGSLTVGALAVAPARAEAPQLLAEWKFDPQPDFLWGSATITDHLDWVGVHFGPTANFDTGPGLFTTVSIHASDTGHAFTADASNDPDFPFVEAQLTNGVTSDNVFVQTGIRGFGAAGALHPESYWAAFNSSPADFSGYDITSIDMYIANAFFTSPGSDPNHDGNWTSYKIDRRFRIYGTPIPEPVTSIMLPTMGMTMLGLRRRRGVR